MRSLSGTLFGTSQSPGPRSYGWTQSLDRHARSLFSKSWVQDPGSRPAAYISSVLGSNSPLDSVEWYQVPLSEEMGIKISTQ